MRKKLFTMFVAFALAVQAAPAFAAGPVQRYADVPVGSEYYEAIEYMSDRGIVSGTGDGNFSPDAPLTMEQLSIILMRLFHSTDYPLSATATASEYVSTASFIGIYDETEAREMKTNGLTRMDMWDMLAEETMLEPYPAWAYTGEEPSVDFERDLEYAVYAAGLYDEKVDADAAPTRGEAMDITYRLITGNYKTLEAPAMWQDVNVIMESPNCWKERNRSMYEWTLIPDKFIQKFKDENWTLRFVEEMKTYYPQHPTSIGMTEYEGRVITIATAFNRNAMDVLAHEFGHFVMCQAQIPMTGEYLYQAEKDKLAELTGSQYCKTNRYEYFAEAFRYILIERDVPQEYAKMKASIPITLNLIENGFLDCECFVDYDAFVLGSGSTVLPNIPTIPSFQFKSMF